MPHLSAAALRKQIADGALQPLYAIVGTDDVGKASAVDGLVATVDEGLRPFNVDRFDASNATNAAAREALAAEVLAAARTLPMMAPHRVVVVQRAHVLLFPKGKSDEDPADGQDKSEPATRRGKKAAPPEDPIEGYLGSPERSTTLVLVMESLPQNRRLGKTLMSQVPVVSFGTEMSEAEAVHWIERQIRAANVSMDASAVHALIRRTGMNIVRIRAGLERVLLYAMGQARVTAEDVNDAVPRAPDAPENFGIANAIRGSDVSKALRELNLALDEGAAPFYLLGQLRTAAEQLPSGRLREAIDALFRTDLALKSSASDPKILLERLVVELTSLARAGSRRPWSGPSRRTR